MPAKHGFTEISLAPAEFEEYAIQLDTSVVFSIKTMRVGQGWGEWERGGEGSHSPLPFPTQALLGFAEGGNHKLELRLEDSGKCVQ